MSAGAGPVDRGALLGLAERLDARAVDLLRTNGFDTSGRRRSMRLRHATDLMTASSAIRRALGASANGLPASGGGERAGWPREPQVGGRVGDPPAGGAHESN